MTPLEALVAITAIIGVFGVSGYIAVKVIQLVREWITARRTPVDSSKLIRRIEQYEMRQEQIVKRIQNLETILVDADVDRQQLPESTENSPDPEKSERLSDRPLKNKLRS